MLGAPHVNATHSIVTRTMYALIPLLTSQSIDQNARTKCNQSSGVSEEKKKKRLKLRPKERKNRKKEHKEKSIQGKETAAVESFKENIY